MAKKKNENTTSIGFEEVIWRAADKLEKGPCWKFGLKTELSGLFAESHKLEEEIRKQLGSIGFNV